MGQGFPQGPLRPEAEAVMKEKYQPNHREAIPWEENIGLAALEGYEEE
jgi:hypothetical protein